MICSEGSVNFKVEEELVRFATVRKEFDAESHDDEEDEGEHKEAASDDESE